MATSMKRQQEKRRLLESIEIRWYKEYETHAIDYLKRIIPRIYLLCSHYCVPFRPSYVRMSLEELDLLLREKQREGRLKKGKITATNAVKATGISHNLLQELFVGGLVNFETYWINGRKTVLLSERQLQEDLKSESVRKYLNQKHPRIEWRFSQNENREI